MVPGQAFDAVARIRVTLNGLITCSRLTAVAAVVVVVVANLDVCQCRQKS